MQNNYQSKTIIPYKHHKKLIISTMKRIFTFFAAIVCIAVMTMRADGFSSLPMPLTEGSANVTIVLNAKNCGQDKFASLTEDDELYAHIGVYTTKKPSTWSYVKTAWPTASNRDKANTEANRFVYQGNGIWHLNIGDLRTYFGLTSEDEHITKVCILARNAAGTVQTADNFIDVVEDGFYIALTTDAPMIMTSAGKVNITFGSTVEADLSIKVDGTTIATGKGLEIKGVYDVTKPGAYKVVATATANGQTMTAEDNIIYSEGIPVKDYPGGKPVMGTVKNADGSVTFCFGAPGKESCYLIGSWSNYKPDGSSIMNRCEYDGQTYFWTTVSGLDNSTYYPYYYHVDNTYSVGDPYAHLILDPYNDKYITADMFPDMPQYPASLGNIMLGVYKGDLDNYDWQVKNFEIPDHYNLSVYELLIRDFTGANRRADGTVRKAIERIPYLKALGINAVELMPIMEFNGNVSWGYNTNFYMAPDKSYGTPDDYKEFIDECHRNGIAVILDIVFNQSDGLHPWYQMYSKTENPFYNANAPHKWSVLNDWNQGHPLVQQQWKDAIRYWLEVYNVDGFRFDLVKGLALNEHYTTNGNNTDSYIKGRVEVMKQINEYITSVKPDAIHINELLGDAKEDNENYVNGGQMGWMNGNNNACQYAMGFNSSSNLNGMYETKWSRTKGACVGYGESHDEQRMAFKQNQWGHANVKNDLGVQCKRLGSVAAQIFMMPGAHMMWMFGEVGADENTKDANFQNNNTDPKPVYWSYLEDSDRNALMQNYKAILNLRLNNPELFSKDTEVTLTGFGNTYNARTIRLNAGNKEAVVFLNPSVTSESVVSIDTKVLHTGNVKMLTASKDFEPAITFEGTNASVAVPAHSFAIFVSDAVDSVEGITIDTDSTSAIAVGGIGCITIAGEYNNAAVYNMSGRSVGLDNLSSGIYIVNIDGNVTKVIVR